MHEAAREDGEPIRVVRLPLPVRAASAESAHSACGIHPSADARSSDLHATAHLRAHVIAALGTHAVAAALSG